MGETRTSVKNVIPDVGRRFSLDESVVSGAWTCLRQTKSVTLIFSSVACQLKSHRGHQLRHCGLDPGVSDHSRIG